MCLPSVYGRTKKKDNYSLLLDIVNEMDNIHCFVLNSLDFSYKK